MAEDFCIGRACRPPADLGRVAATVLCGREMDTSCGFGVGCERGQTNLRPIGSASTLGFSGM